MRVSHCWEVWGRQSGKREIYLAKWSTDGVLKALMFSPHGVKHCLWTARRLVTSTASNWRNSGKKAATLRNLGYCPALFHLLHLEKVSINSKMVCVFADCSFILTEHRIACTVSAQWGLLLEVKRLTRWYTDRPRGKLMGIFHLISSTSHPSSAYCSGFQSFCIQATPRSEPKSHVTPALKSMKRSVITLYISPQSLNEVSWLQRLFISSPFPLEWPPSWHLLRPLFHTSAKFCLNFQLVTYSYYFRPCACYQYPFHQSHLSLMKPSTKFLTLEVHLSPLIGGYALSMSVQAMWLSP